MIRGVAELVSAVAGSLVVRARLRVAGACLVVARVPVLRGAAVASCQVLVHGIPGAVPPAI